MTNPIFYLFAAFIAFSHPIGIEPLYFARANRYILFTPTIFAASIALYTFFCLILYRLLLKDNQPQRNIKNLSKGKLIARITAIILYSIEIYIFHFPLYIEHYWELKGYILISAFLILLPFFILTAINSIIANFFEIKIHNEDASLKGRMIFHFRSFLAFIFIPIMLMLFVNDVIQSSEWLIKLVIVYPFIAWLIGITLIILLLAVAPFIIKIALCAKAIPDSELRNQLLELSKKANFSHSNLLIINTYGAKIGNAFITGLFSKARYVFFTDYLLDKLTFEEVKSVLGHEIGHSKKHHIPLFILFSISFIIILVFIHTTLENIPFTGLWLVVFAIFFWFILFGFVSRRFEMQSDIYGTQLIGDTDIFVSTLEKIGDINNMSYNMSSLRHPSIAQRIFFLRLMTLEPSLLEQFEKKMRNITRIFIIFAIVSITYIGSDIIFQIQNSHIGQERIYAYELAQEGERYLNENHYREAEEKFKEVLTKGLNVPEIHILLGDAIAHRSRNEAKEYYIKALELNPKDPLQRIYLEEMLGKLTDNP